MITREEPGGFLQPILPSPQSSSVSSPSANSILPQPRSKPLKPGSSKESSFVDYVDHKLLGISRRYEKRSNVNLEDEMSSDLDGRGYEEFDEVAKDLETLVDAIWVSGTPSLQKPYFLTIALAVCSYMPSFPFSPVPTFKLLHKLDLILSSLLRGVNIQTGVSLSGFETGRASLSTTEKVRMRGIVERTRVVMVEVAGTGENIANSASGILSPTETEEEPMTDDSETMEAVPDGDDGRWEMEVARVYERTIVELGDSLENFPS